MVSTGQYVRQRRAPNGARLCFVWLYLVKVDQRGQGKAAAPPSPALERSRTRPRVGGGAGFPGRCKHRPLQRFVIAQGCAFPVGRGTSRRRKPGRYGIGPYRGLRCCAVCGFPGGRASPPVCRGGPWPSRGCPRRRNFPVRHRGFPGSVGRAFTPAAPWRFQKSGPCVAAGFGGMGASRPTAARVVAGSHLGRAFAPVRGVRRFMPRPGGRRPRGRACRRCTAASGAGRGGRAGRRRGTGRQRTTR